MFEFFVFILCKYYYLIAARLFNANFSNGVEFH